MRFWLFGLISLPFSLPSPAQRANIAAAAPQSGGRVCAVDPAGLPLARASITRQAAVVALTGGDGCAELPVPLAGAELIVSRDGFRAASATVPEAGKTVSVMLAPAAGDQTVVVTADRGLVGVDDAASSVVALDQAQLNAPPALALDDRLHQAAGFQLYRRTSSWTANPTTEGVSLRGLGSTAASRTLVVSDQVPLNDPFGGWIHWDEIPTLAIADVALERGGAANLYGSSAIGGVISVDPVLPVESRPVTVDADAYGATENSASGDLLTSGWRRGVGWLAAGSGVDTGGYVPTAPGLRGLVDRPSDVAEESGRTEVRTATADGAGSLFLRGNVLNEERGNGTPDQTNGTRLWRYEGGGDANTGLDHLALRLFGDRETYRQSFSSLAASRNSETLTRLQRVPTDELGFSFGGSRLLPGALTAALGVDARDIRATDAESPVSGGVTTSTIDISARQREVGGYAEGIWQPRGWSVAASVRVDSFRTFDGHQTATNTAAVVTEPALDELIASPHLGVVRNLAHGLALTGSGFRAFRGPTMNELYRTGQVGSQTTMANPSLEAERATGFEFGAELSRLGWGGHALGDLRASYFWTEVNRPVSTVTLAQTATTQTLQRQNLGQIRSRGLSVDYTSGRWHGLSGTAGYQLAVATVTAFNAGSALQANLTGKWIPEVPRELATATVNEEMPRVVNLHLIASYTGQSFDDSANQYLLHPYARFDVSGDRVILPRVVRGLSVYAAAQNVLNRSIDAGRTPILTLAAPWLVEGGVRWSLGR